MGLIPQRVEDPLEGGNGNPLQYLVPENPMEESGRLQNYGAAKRTDAD